MKKLRKTILLVFLFGLFFVVRAFQESLFYDPLIAYYQNDYLYTAPPAVDSLKLLVHMGFRYLINTLVSLSILWVLFKNTTILRFSVFFYLFAFFVLIAVFWGLLVTQFSVGYLLPFYVRRFLIHPLFLFIVLPLFYLQLRSQTSK